MLRALLGPHLFFKFHVRGNQVQGGGFNLRGTSCFSFDGESLDIIPRTGTAKG